MGGPASAVGEGADGTEDTHEHRRSEGHPHAQRTHHHPPGALAGLAATAVAATLAACGTSGSEDEGSSGSASAAGSGDDSQVDVVTWWSAGSEKLGLDALVKVFSSQFPDTTFENKAVSGGAGSQAKQKLAADLAAGNPPDTYQAHAGAEIQADIDGWIQDMKTIKDAGYTPITMGMAWTQLELLGTVLIADLGTEGYNGLFDGTTDWDGAEVKKALDHYSTIVSFTDSSLCTEDWEPAMKPVMDGKAAYNVMGDWAVAGLDEAGLKVDTDYVWFPVPGTDGVFDLLADAFTLPDGATHPGRAKNWLQCISSKEGQIAFNTVKGSIPSRSDLTDDEKAEFSDYQKAAMDSFGKDTIVSSIAHGAALPAKASNAMNDALTKFAQGASDVASLQTELKAAYDSVAG